MTFTGKEIIWVTRDSTLDPTPADGSELRRQILDQLDSDSEIIAGNLTTYARFAPLILTDPDLPFLVLVLRECRTDADRLTCGADIDAFRL